MLEVTSASVMYISATWDPDDTGDPYYSLALSLNSVCSETSDGEILCRIIKIPTKDFIRCPWNILPLGRK